jgi:hypothetical protein
MKNNKKSEEVAKTELVTKINDLIINLAIKKNGKEFCDKHGYILEQDVFGKIKVTAEMWDKYTDCIEKSLAEVKCILGDDNPKYALVIPTNVNWFDEEIYLVDLDTDDLLNIYEHLLSLTMK